MKIVINKCFGGFSLSKAAILRLRELGNNEALSLSDSDLQSKYLSLWDIKRNDELLVQVVEELGDAASASLAKLRIVEIPDDVDWEINDYDGMESVVEKSRSWG